MSKRSHQLTATYRLGEADVADLGADRLMRDRWTITVRRSKHDHPLSWFAFSPPYAYPFPAVIPGNARVLRICPFTLEHPGIERRTPSQLGWRGNTGETDPMSESHETEFWLDTWWPLLVIVFGVTFVSILVSFHPSL
jgi:hypothetical protein